MRSFLRRLVAPAFVVVVACGNGLAEDTTHEPSETIPGTQGGTSGAGVEGDPRSFAASGGTRSVPNLGNGIGGVLGARNLDAGEEGEEADEPEVLELDPNWTPEDLGPEAWYVASASDYLVNVPANTATWHDRMLHGHDLTQAVAWAPELEPSGWDGTRPTVHFSGNKLMNASWSSTAPIGTNAEFTVLAVLRADPQTAGAQTAGVVSGVASWWSDWGDGVWANIRATNGLTLLDYHRLDDLDRTQMHVGNQDLGSTGHSVVWRFSPSTQTVTLTVDGVHSVSRPQQLVGSITAMPLIVGATSPLPTGFFNGDISELVIVPRAIDDGEVQDFTEYAVNTWWGGDPPAAGSGPCIKADGTHSPITMRCDDGNPETFGDHCSAGSCVGTVPGPGSPKELSPVAWYHAGDPEVVVSPGGVSTWFDRSSQHRDLMNGYWFRPVLHPLGWNGNKPTVRFAATNALKRYGWTGPPTGTEGAFTVLAVLRRDASQTQSGGVVSWSHSNGYGRTAFQIKPSGGAHALDLYREDQFLASQESVGTTDLGNALHAVAWRYDYGVVKLTVDGVTQVQQQPPIGLAASDVFLMGVANGFGTGAFSGDISELAVIPRSISDTEVARFNAYAKLEWDGFTLCTPNCAGKVHGADNGCGGTCGCDLSAPFDAPIAAFTGAMDADGLTFSLDGRTAYISGAGPGNRDIYVATRNTAADTFGTPTLVTAVNTPAIERAPSLSPDGKLYFTKQPGMFDIGRALGIAPFSGAEVVTAVSSSQQDEDPFWWNDTTLYFASERETGGAHRDLYVATLNGETFLIPTRVPSVLGPSGLHSPAEELRPVLSPDGLTLYFGSTRFGIGNDSQGDVWMARRTPTNPSFELPVNLWGLNSTGTDLPVTVSADGCTLYFLSNEETGLGE